MDAETFVLFAWNMMREEMYIWEDPRSVPPLETLEQVTMAVRAALSAAASSAEDSWWQLELFQEP